jgi:acyl-CoA thioesterase FadM
MTDPDFDPHALQGAREVHQVWISPGWCDVNGHLNAARYAEIFDAAAWRFLAGLTQAADESGPEWSWADVRHETRFLAEIPASRSVTIKAAVLDIGRSSVTMAYGAFTNAAAEPNALCRMVSVRFDPHARASVALSKALRDALQAEQAAATPHPQRGDATP